MKYILLILFVFLISLKGTAQKQSNIWYFGQNAGLDFNRSPVAVLTNGKINTVEGCATIADNDGRLLFYTDGKDIWNKNHNFMKNGRGLLGHESATQSAVIVPGNDNLYYVFTVGELSGPMNYSIVDLSKDNNRGEVISKNNLLLALSTEKVTAVKHGNGTGTWVIGHKWQSDEFYAWLVTGTGVSTNPVISASGTFQGGRDVGGAAGYMKVSPDGTKLALGTNQDDSYVEIYDFDSFTGKISAPQKLTGFRNEGGPYGIEFSPDSKLLYVSDNRTTAPGEIYQVQLPVSSGLIRSKGVILTALVEAGALQLAPDGKIYIAQYQTDYMHTINSPNTPGRGCNLQLNTVYLKGAKSMLGLPTFNQSYFLDLSFSNSNNCFTSPTEFSVSSNITPLNQVSWDFGDPGSGAANRSSDLIALHKYASPGKYVVTVTAFNNGIPSIYKREIVVAAPPIVDLGQEQKLFYGQQTVLKAGNDPGYSYEWNDGSTTNELIVNSPGTYSVIVTNPGGCVSSASVRVSYDQLITVDLPAQYTICEGEVYNLNVMLPGATYEWSTGSNASFINVNEPGTYKVKITNAYGTRTKNASIIITQKTFNDINVETNTILCDEGIAIITANGATGEQKFNWYDSEKNFLTQSNGDFQSPYLTQNATYYVALADGTCLSSLKQINVVIKKPVAVILNKETVINIGESVRLESAGGVGYHWEPADNLSDDNSAITLASPKKDTHYTLTITDENGCTDTTGTTIKVKSAIEIPNTFTPNGDGVNDTWHIKYIEFTKNQVQVFNRYGSMIYTSKNYGNNWNGTRNDEILPAGVYYYIINVDKDGIYKGYITIIR